MEDARTFESSMGIIGGSREGYTQRLPWPPGPGQARAGRQGLPDGLLRLNPTGWAPHQ